MSEMKVRNYYESIKSSIKNVQKYSECEDKDNLVESVNVLSRDFGLPFLKTVSFSEYRYKYIDHKNGLLKNEEVLSFINCFETGIFDVLKEQSVFYGFQLNLLKSLIKAYKSGFFETCLPGVVTLIESALSLFEYEDDTPNAKERVRYNQRVVKDKLNTLEFGLELSASLKSVSGLLDYYFKPLDFQESEEPKDVNRHWLQHGRHIALIVDKPMTLKIFGFLATVIQTIELFHYEYPPLNELHY
ncbi:hypothetical protein [Pseudoalteromonas marina]|uniref:hypothetical protein n=1 Tax=Pseudoalteromonas marina TaxID=267375 RepID=UPI002734F785|nr:hypothetical protein [Pseudoalteromonas marina]MDP2484270.1 hypothetical protein [Pseudoalteromonas marina]